MLKVLPLFNWFIILFGDLIITRWLPFRKWKMRKGGISMWIFRAWITTKDGEKIYAKDHGKRAFRFWVGPGPEPTKKN